jgi:ribose 5-phosphate isomerase B
MKINNIGIGSDHAGFIYKREIIKYLVKQDYEVKDYGIFEEVPISDYEIAKNISIAVINKEIQRGILICGTGIGMCIAANKINGIRAALCNDLFTTKKSREHNESNVLTLGSRVVGLEYAKEIVKVWLETGFTGGRHLERNNYIKFLENKY